MVMQSLPIEALLDTTIVIDLLREYVPAENWIRTQTKLAAASIVWIEVLNGVRNKHDERKALKFLRRFPRVELVSSDFDWAILYQTRYKLSHNVGGIDWLIAAPAHRLNVPLYTMNLKHFAPIMGARAISPY